MQSSEISADVCRSTTRLARQMEFALAGAGLTAPQYRLLSLMSDGSAAGKVLADKLRVSRPTVTGIVEGLVTRGLVLREEDPVDRRRMKVSLTRRGKAALGAADEAVAMRLVDLLDRVPADRAELAIEGLRVIHDALDIRREGKVKAD